MVRLEIKYKKMKLYLIHTGYYDKSVGDGFYEQHTNILVVAENPYLARESVKKNKDYIEKKMHIDGIKEIENVNGYKLQLLKSSEKEKITSYNHYQVRFLKDEL
tara:strand:- start:364 stop:675 length:312 start_codon:yes stop_codon:yes gene_type:complete